MREFIVEPLHSQHALGAFDSGVESLNNWLKSYAMRAQHQGSARTKVLLRLGEVGISGYYSITPTSVDRSEMPNSAAGGLSTVPAYLLARLALDRSLQNRGVGGELLAVALQDIVKASQLVGGRLVVVDAIDEQALKFYEHYGFKRIGQSYRLYERISALV